MGYLKIYWRRYRSKFILAIAFLSMEALADLMQPAIMSRIVDRGVAGANITLIEKYGAVMLTITLIGAICACSRNVLSGIVSQNFAMDLRQDLYTKIQKFTVRTIDRFGPATLITRLTNDVTRVQTFANGMMRIMLKAPLVGIGSLFMAVHLNLKLSLILVMLVPIIALLIYMNMKISFPYFRNVQSALDRVNMSIQEYLSGIRVVKVFNRFSYEQERFQKNNRNLGSLSITAAKVGSLFGSLINLAVNTGIVAILWFGGIGVNHGTMKVGSIIAFINYMTQILFAIMMVNNAFNQFVRAKASAERIGEVMNNKENLDISFDENEQNDQAEKIRGAGRLTFRSVSFSYNKQRDHDEPFLRNINFDVLPGQTIGIIGPIASGKTTLVHLMMRFYDPDEGEILLDGRNIKTLSIENLRERIALVPQKSLLFAGTVRENILWGNDQATDQEVYKAAQTAEADEFIRQSPNGYDSVIGQGGVNFSGGQKQRISIARALIRRPEILILDDAASAVDAQTDRKIREKLNRLAHRPTCLVIAQRISSIIDADVIIVMNNGKIEAMGTHDELMKRSAFYQKIFRSQLGDGGTTHA
ncbi:ABC transporter ATP-binding protein [Sporolactobacillus sp. THM7-4]|nr:ABC transporter ATP-binding protein [Sporolactobacillus sp. THM7-4]